MMYDLPANVSLIAPVTPTTTLRPPVTCLDHTVCHHLLSDSHVSHHHVYSGTRVKVVRTRPIYSNLVTVYVTGAVVTGKAGDP